MYGYRIGRIIGVGVAAVLGCSNAWAQSALTVDLTASGSYTSAYDWSIDKSVTPTAADRFIGEMQELSYTISVVKGDAVESDFMVTGSASIANPGGTGATISAITLNWGGTEIATDCATGALAAGASTTCEFDFAATGSATQTLTMNVTTTGAVAGAQDSVEVAFTGGAVENDSITVSDTLLAGPLTFTGSDTHEYTQSVTCINSNTIKLDNQATIDQTGESDSTRARVACHALRMERNVLTHGGQNWSWEIEKTHAEVDPLQVTAGQTYDVDYTITATATAASDTNEVHGTITAINTHPSVDAAIVSVGAAISGIEAVVTCPALIAPHATYDSNHNIVLGKLVCPFSVTLPDGTVPSTVSGRVTQQLFNYASDGTATAAGTKDYAGTQPITGSLGATETDECITLSDTYLGTVHDLGEFCVSEGSTTVTRTFTGPVNVTNESECAFEVPNVASFLTNDSGTTGEDSTLLSVVRTDCEGEGDLTVDLTASGAFTREFPWTIEKTVDPVSSDRFIGETQQLAYTLTLVKGEAQDAGYVVTGSATITNPGGTAIDITAITIQHGTTAVTHSCTLGALAAGASMTCPISFSAASDDTLPLTIDVDADGGLSADDSVDVVFGAPTVTNDSITVVDTLLPDPIPFSDSGTHEYVHDVTCIDGNTITIDNTATIQETGASDSAQARVACHALRMERAVLSAGGQRWTWDIQKTHAEAEALQMVVGQTYEVDYLITATATASSDGGNEVTGTITALNTNPVTDAVLVSVGAAINSTQATVSCPSLIVPHASYDAAHNIVVGKLVCPFTVTLANGEVPATVSGRLTQQLFTYAPDGTATPAGTKDYAGTQAIASLPGGGEETDECIDLSDVYEGTSHDLGEFCVSEGNTSVTRSFTGAITVTAESECEFSVPNLASLTTNDTGTVVDDDTLVEVVRTDCQQAACTRTQGYWKTHSQYGPAKYDETWATVGEDTPFFLATGLQNAPMSWYDMMWTNPKGNAYYVLAPQFIAATLNLEAGATASPQVLDALDEAQAFFQVYKPREVAAMRGNQAPRPRMIELAGVLDQYNNGIGDLGAEHCSEDETSDD